MTCLTTSQSFPTVRLSPRDGMCHHRLRDVQMCSSCLAITQLRLNVALHILQIRNWPNLAQFSQRMFMCVLVTCIVMAKYLTRGNIRKEGLFLADGVRGYILSCTEAMDVGMNARQCVTLNLLSESGEREMLEFSCFLPSPLLFHPGLQPMRCCHPYSA